MRGLKFLYVLALLIVAFMAVISCMILTAPKEAECQPGDNSCISKVEAFRENCTPSVSVVTIGNGTSYIKLRITIYKEGDRCFTREEVIEDADSGVGPYDITGRNVTCNLTEEELRKYGPHACRGSLFDFVAPSGGLAGGGAKGFGGGTPQSSPPHLYCAINDTQCKMTAASYVSDCVNSEVEGSDVVEYIESGDVYWTIYMRIERGSENCVIYYRVVNAVNLPPEIPPQVIGMDMACTFSLSELPILGISREWCSGDLIDYFDLLNI